MAVVGSAEILVKAVTTGVKRDMLSTFRDMRKDIGEQGRLAGKEYGEKFRAGARTEIQSPMIKMFNDLSDNAGVAGRRGAEKYGKEFTKEMDAKKATIQVGKWIDDKDFNSSARAMGHKLADEIGEGAKRGGARLEREVGLAADRSGKKVEKSLGGGGGGGRRSGKQFGIDWSSSFVNEALAANKAFTLLYGIGNLVGSAITAVVGAIGALGNALIVAGQAAGYAAGSLIVLPSLITAAAQAMITLKVAFRGVGEALKLGFKSASDGAKDTTKATEGAANRIRDARQRLADAYQDAAYRQAQAARTIIDAEQELVNAQLDLIRSQNALNDAFAEGREELEDIAFAAEDAAIAEEEAALRLEDAVVELQRVQNLPPDNRSRREAELGYQRAELAFRQAKDRNEDMAKVQKDAAEAGIEGTNAVVDARNEIADAEQDVIDKQKTLAAARIAEERSAVQSARAIRDAREALADALASANQGLADATSATDKFEEALAKLPKSAQEFVRKLVSMKSIFDELRESAADGLFPALTRSLDTLRPLFEALNPIFFDTGQALGYVAESIAEVVSSAGFLKRLDSVAETNNTSIRRIGDAFGSLINAMTGVLVAAGPLVDRFTAWIQDIADRFESFATSTDGIGRMEDFFNRAGDVAASLGTTIGNVISALDGLGNATGPAMDYMLERLETLSARWAEQTQLSGEALTEQQHGFQNAVENSGELLGLLGDIGKLFSDLGKNPALEVTFNRMRDAIPPLYELGEAITGAGLAFADLIVAVSEMIAALADTGAIEVFYDTLSAIVDTITDFIKSDFGQYLLKELGPVLAMAKAFGLAYIAASFFFKVVAGGVLTILKPFKLLNDRVNLTGKAMKGFKTQGAATSNYLKSSKGFFNTLGGAVLNLGGFIIKLVNGFGRFLLVGAKFAGIAGLIITAVMGIFQAIKNIGLERFKEVWEKITGLFSGKGKGGEGGGLKKAMEGLMKLIKGLGDIVAVVFEVIIRFVLNVVEVATQLINKFEFLYNFMGAVLGAIGSVISGVAGFVGGLFKSKEQKETEARMEAFKEKFVDIDTELERTLRTGGVAAAEEAFGKFRQEALDAGYSLEEVEEMTPGFNLAMEKAAESAGGASGELYNFAENADEAATAYEQAIEKIGGYENPMRAAEIAVDNASTSLEELREAAEKGVNPLLENSDAGRVLRDALDEVGSAGRDAAIKTFAATGDIDKAMGVYNDYVDEIKAVGTEYGLTGDDLTDFVTKYAQSPKELKMSLEATNIDETDAALNTIYQKQSGRSITWDLDVKTQLQLGERWAGGIYVGGQARAEGGPIIGPGGPKDDKAGMFALSNGEFVLSASAVSAMGGMRAVDSFHKSMKSGASSSDPNYTLNANDPGVITFGEQAIVDELRSLRSENGMNGGMSVTIGSINSGTASEVANETIHAMRSEAWRLGIGL